jgi:single-stranded-DNA-specific exonuclease
MTTPKPWREPDEVASSPELQQAVGGHPLVAQVLAQRGYHTPVAARAFLDPSAYQPASPYELPGMQQAVDRLARALADGECIGVWGDFDVDGQTATALLVEGLKELGAQVISYIPVRARESHGVNLPGLEAFLGRGAQVLLTCDTGIDAVAAADYARQRGVDLIITDHHDLPERLPRALALVNPKFLPAEHPLAALPGVGVAYKLLEALYVRFGRAGETERFLDLVALGIVADVAVQTDDARYLLQRGLAVLRQTPRAGLQALFENAEFEPSHLTEEHIGYVIGPRLNALGRLDDANSAVEFLTTRDPGRARLLALNLEGLNAQRRLLTEQVFQGVLAQIEREPALAEAPALVFAHPAWPAGMIGIVANRLVERFHRPAVLIATPQGEFGRGSARSVAGLNITAAIAANRALLQGFGGHPMAAGLSIEPERIPEFRRALGRTVQRMLGEAQVAPELRLDAYLPLSDLTPELVADLERLAPFGAGNPPLALASRAMTWQGSAPIGRGGEHLQVTVQDEGGAAHRLLWWQGAGWPIPQGAFDLAYTARSSTYQGRAGLQIEWLDFRPLDEPALEVTRAPALEVHDYRRSAQPERDFAALELPPATCIWLEGGVAGPAEGLPRHALFPAETLVVWFSPPSPAELSEALGRVRPRRVYLFAVDPGLDEPRRFLERLAGLVKYALREGEGAVPLERLAAACSQRAATIRLGLDWLAAQGHIRVYYLEGGLVRLEAGDQTARGGAGELLERLDSALQEAAAYRGYYRRAGAEGLVEGSGDSLSTGS